MRQVSWSVLLYKRYNWVSKRSINILKAVQQVKPEQNLLAYSASQWTKVEIQDKFKVIELLSDTLSQATESRGSWSLDLCFWVWRLSTLAHICPLSWRLPFPATYWTPSLRYIMDTWIPKQSTHFTPINLFSLHSSLSSVINGPTNQTSLESWTWEWSWFFSFLSLSITNPPPTPTNFQAKPVADLSTCSSSSSPQGLSTTCLQLRWLLIGFLQPLLPPSTDSLWNLKNELPETQEGSLPC